MMSRNGSQTLAELIGAGTGRAGSFEKGLIKSVITPAALAGFDSPESVATCMAGFDRGRPRQPGWLTRIPAAFR
jgi:hypothetical protein